MAGPNQLLLISYPVVRSTRNVESDISAVFDHDDDTPYIPATESTIALQRCLRQSQEQRQKKHDSEEAREAEQTHSIDPCLIRSQSSKPCAEYLKASKSTTLSSPPRKTTPLTLTSSLGAFDSGREYKPSTPALWSQSNPGVSFPWPCTFHFNGTLSPFYVSAVLRYMRNSESGLCDIDAER